MMAILIRDENGSVRLSLKGQPFAHFSKLRSHLPVSPDVLIDRFLYAGSMILHNAPDADAGTFFLPQTKYSPINKNQVPALYHLKLVTRKFLLHTTPL